MTESSKPISDICCPVFDPAPWQEKLVVWDHKKFIKGSIPAFMHFPIPGKIEKLMSKLQTQAETANATYEAEDFLCISCDPSPWKTEYYYAVTKEVPGAENVELSGEFFTQVFDGQYSEIPNWIKTINSTIESQGRQIEQYYFFYTTCPKCAKLHGHNYVVSFTKLK